MAVMLPPAGPVINASVVAEPLIYRGLAEQLDDSFIVIHSLPWLARAVQTLTQRRGATGQIDFLVLHPDLGILAIEVKGGVVDYEHPHFVVRRTGERFDVFEQLNRGVYALPKWIARAGGPSIIIGYAFVFPESSMHGRPLPPILVDTTAYPMETMVIDHQDISHIGERVLAIMRYWKQTLRSRPYTKQQIDDIVALLCPSVSYTPPWSARIQADRDQWLLLTAEQARELSMLGSRTRTILTGRSGTGKTIIALTHARQLVDAGEHPLFLVYNRPLAQRLTRRLQDIRLPVLTFHDLCRQAYRALRRAMPSEPDDNWYYIDGPDTLQEAIANGALCDRMGHPYTALIIDEAQVYADGWLSMLGTWFADRPVLICCDDTQVLPFERYVTSTELIREIVQAPIRTLVVSVRSPRAVFDRLEAALPVSPIQQYSPRDHDPAALTEIVSPDPPAHLLLTLQALAAEGVTPEDIALLHIGSTVDLPEQAQPLIGEVMQVARFRGLEAAVVIVYIPDTRLPIDRNTLACAYGRSTTRLIAIYPLDAFVTRDRHPVPIADERYDFLPFVHANAAVQAQIATMWPLSRALGLQSVCTPPTRIMWAPHWRSWFLPIGFGEAAWAPEIERELWIRHLLHTTRHPCMLVWVGHNQYPPVRVRQPPATLTDEIKREQCSLAWCVQCERWTRTLVDERHRQTTCLECGTTPDVAPLPEEAVTIRQAAAILADPNAYESNDKRALSIFLIALGRWRKLNEDQQRYIAENMSKKVRSAYYVAKLLVGIEAIVAPVGMVLSAGNLSTRLYALSPWLRIQMTERVWQAQIERSLDAWRQRGWLELADTRLSYRRIELPPGWWLDRDSSEAASPTEDA